MGGNIFPNLSDDWIRALDIFHFETLSRITAAHVTEQRFVHYTSADTAMRIIQGAHVWMRNSSCMNDFMEIEHGLSCLNRAIQEHESRFKLVFDSMFPDLADELLDLFNGWVPHFRERTYISCLSEHNPPDGPDEDELGRLSMWRAYGGRAGVAIVVKGAPFLTPSDALNANTHPVSYLDPSEFAGTFASMIDRVEAHAGFVKSLGRGAVTGRIFDVFRTALLCTKHKGFWEEREWRIIYTPTYRLSKHICHDYASVGGTPQKIYKIPLKDLPDEGLDGISIPKLIDRVIIGPTEHPRIIRDALISLLETAGMVDAAQRVHVSDIPLRQ